MTRNPLSIIAAALLMPIVMMVVHHETGTGWPLTIVGIVDPFYNHLLWGVLITAVAAFAVNAPMLAAAADEGRGLR